MAVRIHVEDVAEVEGHGEDTQTEEADSEDPYVGALVGDRGDGNPGAVAAKHEQEVALDDELGNPGGLPVQIAPDCEACQLVDDPLEDVIGGEVLDGRNTSFQKDDEEEGRAYC